MKIYERIDLWLIERVFQPCVDFFQRRPDWWLRQLAGVLLLLSLISAVPADGAPFTGWDALALLLDLLVVTFIYGCGRSPTRTAWVGRAGAGLRMFMLVLLALPHRTALGFAASLVLLACYYFAACRPPKPREPKAKMAPAPG